MTLSCVFLRLCLCVCLWQQYICRSMIAIHDIFSIVHKQYREQLFRCGVMYISKHTFFYLFGCGSEGMGLLPDTKLRVANAPGMPGTFSSPPTRKPLVNDPDMHHGTYATPHVPWCISGSLTRVGGENVPGVCATRNFTYLVRGPLGGSDMCWQHY